MMKTLQSPFFSCLFLLIFAPSAAGQLFQWTDFQGTVHFTDNFLAVPESVRRSSDLLIRHDWGRSEVSAQSTSEPFSTEPAPNVPVPETPRPPEGKADPVNQIIYYRPQQITIVQITKIVRSREPELTPTPRAKRSFDDRQFIHPSVFGGSPQPHIHPEVLSSSRR
jgi:hypothetical protein